MLLCFEDVAESREKVRQPIFCCGPSAGGKHSSSKLRRSPLRMSWKFSYCSLIVEVAVALLGRKLWHHGSMPVGVI
jgi:hypothetical protein